MEDIIAGICVNFITEVINFFSESKARSMVEMETSLKQKADQFIVEMIKVYFKGIDKAIEEDKAGRRKKGIVIERKGDDREVYTKFGYIEFNRTYYYDKRRYII
ncbi:MAG: hypothetical protein GX754_12250 [Clostridiaceae bacterium]|nr:hypothetical protein [Clostridiaceae bacterium]